MLNGRQGTFVSGVLFSKRSVFSLIVILLNFWRKYLSSFLFLKIVISGFVGFVLCLCQDSSWLIDTFVAVLVSMFCGWKEDILNFVF